MLYLASDHGGFKLKSELISFLDKLNVPYQDLGPYELIEGDDFTEYVEELVKHMRADNKKARGVLICRNGVGVTIYANKFKGIRCALCFSPKHAASARNDDDSNVLALAGDYTDTETAIAVVEKWLTTDFSHTERHYRRIDKVNSRGE